MEFDELQKAWQEKQAPEESALAQKSDGIMQRIRKVQRQAVFSGLGVSVSFALVFVMMGWMWNNFGGVSLYFDIGIALIFLDMIVALCFIWSLVIKWNDKGISLDSLTFIEHVLKKLKLRQQILLWVIPIYILVLVLGINLVYLHTQSDFPLNQRLWIHGTMSLGTFLIYPISYYFYRKSHKKNISPLIEDLQEIKSKLKG